MANRFYAAAAAAAVLAHQSRKVRLGLEPFTTSAAFLPVSKTIESGGERHLQVRFVQPAGLSDVTYKGEVSGNRIQWSDHPDDVETIDTPGPGED